MRAAHAKCGRAVHHNVGNRLTHSGFHAKSGCHSVGRQFAHSRQSAVHTSAEFLVVRESAQQFLVNRIAFLNYQNIVVLVDERLHHLLRQRVLRNLEHGQFQAVVLAYFHNVVITNAERNHALFAFAFNHLVESRFRRCFFKRYLFVNQLCVVLFGDGGQQNPLARVHVGIEAVLVAHWLALDNRPRVRHTCRNSHNHRHFHRFRQFKSGVHGVVGLLLCRWLENGQHCKASVSARVLLVLRRVHRRVVGHNQNQTAVDARDGRVHKRVGAHVQAHVLHTNNAAFARKRHTQRGLVGCFLVGRPLRADAAPLRLFRFLYKFSDFSRRCARIGIDARNACVNRTHGNRFGTQ